MCVESFFLSTSFFQPVMNREFINELLNCAAEYLSAHVILKQSGCRVLLTRATHVIANCSLPRVRKQRFPSNEKSMIHLNLPSLPLARLPKCKFFMKIRRAANAGKKQRYCEVALRTQTREHRLRCLKCVGKKEPSFLRIGKILGIEYARHTSAY